MKNAKIVKDGAIHQITLPDLRFYKIKNKYYPSVTWILEAHPKGIGFYRWLASKNWDEAERIKEESGDRGSKVHNAIYDLLKGKIVKIDDKYWNDTKKENEKLTLEEWTALLAFQNWYKDYHPKFLASEKIIYSQKWGYAGMMDALIQLGKERVLVDWKTSAAIYPSYELQVAAYANAALEMKGKVHKTAILRLNAKTKQGYQFKIFDDFTKSFKTFLAVKEVWRFEHPQVEPKIVEYPNKIRLFMPKRKK